MKKVLLVVLLSLLAQIFPVTYYISNDTGNDSNNGSESLPWKTISKGIQSSISGDVLDLTGTFLLTTDPGITSNGLEITKNLTIQGHGPKVTFVKAHPDSGMAATRVFYVSSAVSNAIIKDISIQNGKTTNGGGILNYGTLTLLKVNISRCNATNGGGFFNNNIATIEDCNIYNNFITLNGGGICNAKNISINRCSIFYNNAKNGGGVASVPSSRAGSTTIINSTISSNYSTFYGGGIYFYPQALTANSEITAVINCSTIAFNDASLNLGREIYNLTNTASGFSSTINFDLRNSILYCLTANNLYTQNTSSGGTVNFNRSYTISIDDSMPLRDINGNLDYAFPFLGTLKDNGGYTLTHALTRGCAPQNAIPESAGTEPYNGAPISDQRGESIYAGSRDLGAYEVINKQYHISNETGDDSGDGSINLPWKTISHGIFNALAQDTLNLTGTFILTDDPGVTADGLDLIKDITLIGQSPSQTFIKAAAVPNTATKRLFFMNYNFSSGYSGTWKYMYNEVVIKDITLENGVDDNGGCIYACGKLMLDNVNIKNNHSSNLGGAVYFTSNSIAGDPELFELNIKNSSIFENISDNSGGAIYTESWGDVYLENCTISGNSSNASGAGLYCKGHIDPDLGACMSYININNCTIAYNASTSGIGGNIGLKGIFLDMGPGGTAFGNITCTLKNSIIAHASGNTNYIADAGGASITLERSYTICSDNSMPDGSINGNMNSTDPLLGILADNGGETLTHALTAGSPAIDKLSGPLYNGAPILDQRGLGIYGDLKDLGSFEYGNLTIPQGVNITNTAGEVQITWDAVSGATSYKVYASSDPYGTYTDISSQGTFAGTSWSQAVSGNKLFFYVVAVKE